MPVFGSIASTCRITIETVGNSRICDVRVHSQHLQMFAAKVKHEKWEIIDNNCITTNDRTFSTNQNSPSRNQNSCITSVPKSRMHVLANCWFGKESSGRGKRTSSWRASWEKRMLVLSGFFGIDKTLLAQSLLQGWSLSIKNQWYLFDTERSQKNWARIAFCWGCCLCCSSLSMKEVEEHTYEHTSLANHLVTNQLK